MENEDRKLEIVLWSIAFPGFGQILNGEFLKALLFVGLEFLVNVQSNFNTIIIDSFHWNTIRAINQTDYQWLMFYPCLYTFAIWDAYRDAGGGKSPYAVLPTVAGAYVGTVGVIYSRSLSLIGIKFGPVWLGMMGTLLGVLLGAILRKILLKRTTS